MVTSDVSTGPHQAPLGQPVPSWGIFSRGHREQAPVAPHDVDSSDDEEYLTLLHGGIVLPRA